MIGHLADIAKLIAGVAVGTLIGSYIMEWRIKRMVNLYLPLLLLALGGKKKDEAAKVLLLALGGKKKGEAVKD